MTENTSPAQTVPGVMGTFGMESRTMTDLLLTLIVIALIGLPMQLVWYYYRIQARKTIKNARVKTPDEIFNEVRNW